MIPAQVAGYPGSSAGKESACRAGDLSLTPGEGGAPKEGNGNPLQCSYLENLWVEEPGGLQSTGPQTEMTERLILFHPRGAVVKNLLANAGDTGLIPGPGRFHC